MILAAALTQTRRRHKSWAGYAPLAAVKSIYSGTAVYEGAAGSGPYVHLVLGNANSDTLYFRSTDEGATWAAPVNLGVGSTFLNQPIMTEGSTVGLLRINSNTTITDFAGVRPVGPVNIRRSTNNGATWDTAIVLDANAKAFRVGFSISGGIWNATWMDYRSGTTWDIYHCRSTDNGATWSTPSVLIAGNDSEGMGAERPDLWHDGNYVHLVWMDARDERGETPHENGTLPNGTEIYYKRSADGGATWGADVRLTTSGFWADGTTPLYSGRPTVIAKNGAVVVTYDRRPDANGNEIVQMRSTDNGATWSAYTPLTNSTGAGDATHGQCRNGRLSGEFWLVWGDEKTGAELGYERVTYDGGASWLPERVLSTPAGAPPPSLAASANYVHFFWTDAGYSELFHQRHKITTP